MYCKGYPGQRLDYSDCGFKRLGAMLNAATGLRVICDPAYPLDRFLVVAGSDLQAHQKQMLSKHVLPFVQQHLGSERVSESHKVAGALLEMEVAELLHLLKDRDADAIAVQLEATAAEQVGHATAAASEGDDVGCDLCRVVRFAGGVKQRDQHLNGKKHRANLKACGNNAGAKKVGRRREAEALTELSFAGWSIKSTWSADDCAAIQREFERARQRHSSVRCPGDSCSRSFCVIDCQTKQWAVRKDLPELEGCLLAEGHPRPAVLKVIREMQKGAAHHNKEQLYRDDAAVAALRSREPRDARGLKALAWEHNCSTSDLGRLLAGNQAMLQAVAALTDEDEASVVTPYATGAKDDLHRKQWAEAAVELAKNDSIGGHRVACQDTHLQRGTDGESMLAKALDAAGVPISSYKTESQQVAAEFVSQERGKRATPDVLFNAPIEIQGVSVKWIEVKNKLLIPGVSSEDELASYDKQIERYIERFGAGAVVWATKNAPHTGFCQTIQRRHADVVHFNLAQTGGSGNHKPKNKQFYPQQTYAHTRVPTSVPTRTPKADRSSRLHNSTFTASGGMPLTSDQLDLAAAIQRSCGIRSAEMAPTGSVSLAGFGVGGFSGPVTRSHPITIMSSLDASHHLTQASIYGHRLGATATPTTTPPAGGVVDADSLQRQRATQRAQRAAAAESRLKDAAS